MSQVTSSHFTKYFYNTYSEYIQPWAVMTYATTDAIWAMPPRLRNLCSRGMVCFDWVDNTMDNPQE
jgi:hypothetical protein